MQPTHDMPPPMGGGHGRGEARPRQLRELAGTSGEVERELAGTCGRGAGRACRASSASSVCHSFSFFL